MSSNDDFASAATERLRLGAAYDLLSENDHDSFWPFAARYVVSVPIPKGVPRPDKSPYDGLCAAIEDLERKGGKKHSPTHFPRIVRRLSTDNMSKAVLRLRNRLLNNEFAESALATAFCAWVQSSKQAILVAAVRALECECTDTGALKGVLGHRDSELAQQQLLALVEAHSAYDLSIVCAGLMVNHEQWSFLGKACQHLADVANQSPTRGVTNSPFPAREQGGDAPRKPEGSEGKPTQGSTSASRPCSSNDETTTTTPSLAALPDIRRLRADSSSLADLLSHAAEEATLGRVTHPSDVTPFWTELHQRFSAAQSAVGLDNSASLTDIEAATSSIALRAERDSITNAISPLQFLTVADGKETDVLAEVRSKAEELIAGLKHGDLDAADEVVMSASALVTLIERHGTLDQRDAFSLFSKASHFFGNEVALAATMGSLRFKVAGEDAPALPERTKLDESAEQPAESGRTSRAVPSDSKRSNSVEADTASLQRESYGAAGDSAEAEHIARSAEATPEAKPDEPSVAVEVSPSSSSTGQAGVQRPEDTVVGTKTGAHVSAYQDSPLELCTFDTFLTRYWLNRQGDVAVAPWLSKEFLDKLADRAGGAWASGQYGLAALLARAAQLRGGDVGLDPDELMSAARLVSQPDDFIVARNVRRLASIRASDAKRTNNSLALSLTLEALAPTPPLQLSTQEIEKLLAAAAYSTPMLEEVVRFLLEGWASATDPLQLLRTELESASAADPETLQQELRNAQRRLQEVVAALYLAAGGRIQRTHCRKAWAEFVNNYVGPLRAELAPLPTEKRQTHFPSRSVASRVIEIGRAFQRIMDAGGVKHQDLAAATSAAEQIVTAVQDVVDSMSQVEQAAQKTSSVNPLPIESLSKLMTDLPSDCSDRLCTVLLRARVSRQAQHNPLCLPATLLVRCPALLGTLAPTWLSSSSLAEGLPLEAFSDPLAAASLLIDVTGGEDDAAIPADALLSGIRDAVVDTGRIELLGALASTEVLQPHERNQLHRRALERGDETYNQALRLERAWLACDELVHPGAAQLRDIAATAVERCTAEPSEASPFETSLLASWVSQQVVAAEAARDDIIQIRIDQAARRSPEIAKEVELNLRAHRYHTAMALLDPSLPKDAPASGQARRTMWRSEALEKFPRPTFALEHELRSANAVMNLLAVAWAGTAADPKHPERDSIRRAFYEVISGEAGLSQENKRTRFAVKLQDLREHFSKKTIIRSAALRQYLKRAKLNPCFLPQLHDYEQLALFNSGLRGAGNTVEVISKDVNQEGAGTLCIYLEPGIPIAKRDDVTAALRRRGVSAVVIDDIDLCRLASIHDDVEGHNFIPFLEIVLEQLDLEVASPFSSLDGQHVRIETFVGRAQAAHKIAMTSSYTRLFSGRKLGKSAFLQHVTHSFDREKAPSKNTLNVIFITIAGGESENWVVDCIIKEMNGRFGLPMEVNEARQPSPADRYSAYARRFSQNRPSDNVLLILDEADAFVDGQLRAYDRANREGSLSFRMMKESSAGVDSAQMPRIRILFSGYRATNTRGGVWANAGDVLILQPLAEQEATDFLRGMLGRIGVDIGEHAPFAARRCGYQPAVLIRFGDTLLRRLKRNSRSGKRESLTVSYEDVQSTMAEQPVVDEIRTVVNNNFQGNRVAAAIFAATLLALKDLQPGMALDDGPSQVLTKISEIDPNLDWLTQFGPLPLAHIERQLQEFIARELLAVTDAGRFGARQYRLRFPHFLPVLTQHGDLSNEIRLHIQHIRAGGAANRFIESVLPDASLDAARYWNQQKTAGECALVAVGGHWVEALVNSKVGLPDRLGANDADIVDASLESDLVKQVKHGLRVFKNISAPAFARFTGSTPRRPVTLIGGIDLVRAARLHSLNDQSMTAPTEVISLGRLSEATVAWWFDVARALHFQSPDAFGRIFNATAGVPMLVRELDRLLPHSPSADVSSTELQAALHQLEQGCPRIASQLVEGDNATRLTTRELELLKMAFLVSSLESEFDLGQEFSDFWEIFVDGKPRSVLPPLTDTGDQVALQVLIDAGLIDVSARAPTRGGSILGRVNLRPDDPVQKLLAALEPIRED